MPSFDVVSEVDKHELTNAVDTANRELGIHSNCTAGRHLDVPADGVQPGEGDVTAGLQLMGFAPPAAALRP